VAAAEPEHTAVRRDAAHVGAAATWDVPLGDDPLPREADHGHGALAAVRDVEFLAVPARIEAVRVLAGRDEADDLEAVAVDLPHAVRGKVRNVEQPSVG